MKTCSVAQQKLLQLLDSIKNIVEDLDDDKCHILMTEIESALDELADEGFFGLEHQLDPRNQ